MVTPSWSLIRSKESMRFGMSYPVGWHNWWLLYHSCVPSSEHEGKRSSWTGGYIDFTSRYQLPSCSSYSSCLLSKYSLKVREVHTTSTTFEPWDRQFSIIDYALHDILPNDPKEATSIQRRSPHFYYDPEVKTLYHHSYDGILLRCLSTHRHKKYSKKLMMTYAVPISQVRS